MSFNQWKSFKLEEIVEPGTTITYGVVKPGDEDINGVKFIRGGDIANGKILIDNLRTITQEVSDQYKRTQLKGGELVISLVGNPGEVAIVPQELKGANLARQVGVVRLRNDIEKRFVKYFLISPLGKERLFAKSVGSVQQVINLSDLRDLEIYLPDAETQRRIADILSALDEKIELNRQTNATLEAIAQSIFREWFVEFNFPGATGEIIESELEMIPKGWKVGKLKDFGDIVCGKTPSKANPNYFGGEIPFVKIPDMHDSVFITKTEDSLTGEGAQSQKNKFIPPYSVIVSCIATVGLVAITSEKSQTNQQINAIIPKRECLSFYLYFRMKELEGVLKDMGSGGSATLNVNTSSFSNIECIIPPDSVLNDFDKIVRSQFEKILSNEHETAFLTSLRDTLLPKLMSGEIEV